MITYGGAQNTASRDQIDNEPEASSDQFCELHVMLRLLCQKISFFEIQLISRTEKIVMLGVERHSTGDS